MRGGYVLLAAVALSSNPATSQEMPRYDVAKHCRQVAEFGGTYSAVTEDGCFSMEQSAYDRLKDDWTTLPTAMRAHCGEIAQFSGGGNYSTLEGCVRMEREASDKAGSRTFKY